MQEMPWWQVSPGAESTEARGNSRTRPLHLLGGSKEHDIVSETMKLYMRTELGRHNFVMRVDDEALFPRWYGGSGPVVKRVGLRAHILHTPPQ